MKRFPAQGQLLPSLTAELTSRFHPCGYAPVGSCLPRRARIASTMDAPPVRYVTTTDGCKIAYSVSGAGRPLVFVGPALGGMAHLWRFFPDWMEGLTRRFRLIQHDLRGHGLSQHGIPHDFGRTTSDDYKISVSDESDTQDLLDRLRLDRFILFGLAGVGHVAVRYAVAHPEQVEALILSATPVTSGMPSFYRDVAAENWEFFLRSLAPASLGSEESQSWFESLYQSTTYEDWLIRGRMTSESDLGIDLPLVQVPTLVLLPRDQALASAEGIKALAAAIPGARLVAVKGQAVLGDATEGIAAIESFLAELPGQRKDVTPGGDLSAREIEVLRLLAAGRSNQQIAEELVISASTVAKHLNSIFAKGGFNNRTEAAAYAHRNRLA
jgi:pimeloyl-ACP methyl ester carboxylesterase/DNA-binding CsgD family transcriptional regulator